MLGSRSVLQQARFLPPSKGILVLRHAHTGTLIGGSGLSTPSAIGRRIEIHADLQRVWVTCEGTTVADHARVWAKHQTISDFEHLVAAKLLRRGRLDLVRPPTAELEVETRDLASYDTALGVEEGAD